MTFDRPPKCAGCPLESGPGRFVPPYCNCPRCGPYRDSEAILDLAYGPNPRLAPASDCQARLLVVGIAPGEDEERLGRPFVGHAGRLKDSGFKYAGITEPHITMNMVQCRTMRVGRTKVVNRDPTTKEVRACVSRWLWPWLEAFERRTDGEGFVLALGALAFKWLSGESQGSFHESRGHRLRLKSERAQEDQRSSPFKQPRLRECSVCGELLPPRKRKCPRGCPK